MQPHLFRNESSLVEQMVLNKEFALVSAAGTRWPGSPSGRAWGGLRSVPRGGRAGAGTDHGARAVPGSGVWGPGSLSPCAPARASGEGGPRQNRAPLLLRLGHSASRDRKMVPPSPVLLGGL